MYAVPSFSLSVSATLYHIPNYHALLFHHGLYILVSIPCILFESNTRSDNVNDLYDTHLGGMSYLRLAEGTRLALLACCPKSQTWRVINLAPSMKQWLRRGPAVSLIQMREEEI